MSKVRAKSGWSRRALHYVEKVSAVIGDLREYWPLTLRQVYYQLVATGIIENDLREYQELTRVLAKARLHGLVPWDALEDRARATLHADGWGNQAHFVEDELKRFLDGYRRDLLQGQPWALELWVEKDALSHICHRVAFDYCVPVIVARGFSSISHVHECRKRVERNTARGKNTAILYFGDLDPSGWEMLPSMSHTLQCEMELEEKVCGYRYALTPEQVEEYNLPHVKAA